MSGRESEVSDKLGYKVKHLYPDWQLGVNEQPGRATLCLLRVYFSDWQASSPRLLLAQHEVILHACRGRTLWGKWDKTMLSNCLLRNEHTDVKTNIKTWMVPFKELTQTLGQTTVGRRELTNLNVSSVMSPMKIHSTYLSTETKYTRHSNESVGRNVRIKRYLQQQVTLKEKSKICGFYHSEVHDVTRKESRASQVNMHSNLLCFSHLAWWHLK